MWVLECTGDLLGGKKKWLKPGQRYLFGRTKDPGRPDEQFHAIHNKSVSRKHLVISVSDVAPGQGDQPYTKSLVTITDESKLGTQLDGEKLLNESRTLTAKVHTIKLGSYDQLFRISWRPVLFTFSYTIREQEKSDDILAPFREKLECFDMKVALIYSIIDTTYVVASKRNIPKNLQALINGKHIVKEPFIDAVHAACLSQGLSKDGVTQLPSPLEDDFESNWPDAIPYLPDPGKEPVLRPSELFAPDPNRISLFEGFTFVFADQMQYEQLSPVVTNGGAKALKYDLQLGQTSLKDFVEYVRNVAEQKGIKELAQTDSKKKVVVVRFRGKGSTEEWALDFLRGLDLELGQRSVEQNEFLDAILMSDARPLHRALEEEDAMSSGMSPEDRNDSANQVNVGSSTERGEQHTGANDASGREQNREPEQPVSRSRFRRPVVESRFKGFDDFDPSQAPKATREDSPAALKEAREDVQHHSRPQSIAESNSQSLFVSDSRDGVRSSKKRTLPEEDDAEEDPFETLLPAAAAMKRRRVEQAQAENEKTSSSKTPTLGTPPEETQNSKNSAAKKTRDIDLLTEARAQAQREDVDRSRGSESRLNVDANSNEQEMGEDISQLRNLVLVEELPLPVRSRPQRSGQGDANAKGGREWDPRWNGLKNFKKFHRHGDRSAPAANRGRRALVGLEEVKRKDFGIGESYWLEPATSSSKRDRRKNQASTQSQRNTQKSGAEMRISGGGGDDDVEEILPEEIAGQPREGPVADALASQQVSVGARNAKRARELAGSTAPATRASGPAKRTRAAQVTVEVSDDESSDEDEFKFRLKKRRT